MQQEDASKQLLKQEIVKCTGEILFCGNVADIKEVKKSMQEYFLPGSIRLSGISIDTKYLFNVYKVQTGVKGLHHLIAFEAKEQVPIISKVFMIHLVFDHQHRVVVKLKALMKADFEKNYPRNKLLGVVQQSPATIIAFVDDIMKDYPGYSKCSTNCIWFCDQLLSRLQIAKSLAFNSIIKLGIVVGGLFCFIVAVIWCYWYKRVRWNNYFEFSEDDPQFEELNKNWQLQVTHLLNEDAVVAVILIGVATLIFFGWVVILFSTVLATKHFRIWVTLFVLLLCTFILACMKSNEFIWFTLNTKSDNSVILQRQIVLPSIPFIRPHQVKFLAYFPHK